MDRRSHHHKLLFAVTFLVFIAAATGFAAAASSRSAASPDQRPPTLQIAIDQVVATGVPGVVALRREGNRTTTFRSGYGNLATKTPAVPATGSASEA